MTSTAPTNSADPTPQILPAEPSDIAPIKAIITAAYSPYIPRLPKPPAPLSTDYTLAAKNKTLFTLHLGARICGSIILLNGQDSLIIDNMAIDPEIQGKGLGRVMLGFAEGEAKTRGFAALSLYTNVLMVENLGLYPRWGFLETGRRTEEGFHRVFFRMELG